MECKNPENEQVLKFIREFERAAIESKVPIDGIAISAGFSNIDCLNGAYGDEDAILAVITTLIYELTTKTGFSLSLNETMIIINTSLRKMQNNAR